jgi:hypothetical protein
LGGSATSRAGRMRGEAGVLLAPQQVRSVGAPVDRIVVEESFPGHRPIAPDCAPALLPEWGRR